MATTGSRPAPKAAVTRDTRGSDSGCRRFHRSTSSASVRSRPHDVTAQASAAMPKRSARMRCASIATLHIGPGEAQGRLEVARAPRAGGDSGRARRGCLAGCPRPRPPGGGHGIRLVVEREIPEAVHGVRPEHLGDRRLDDHGHLVGERRVVDERGGVGRGQEGRLAVVVLQPLTHERRPPGGAAGEDAAAADVTERPGQVADALEPEHRIEQVHRHHGLAPRGVRRGQGRERRPTPPPR